jgi:uncharacterized protein (DUF1015 family)
MPDIQAFRGLRYDLGHVGALRDVVAPPYDVIDAEFQDRLYQRHPANVIRLILNRQEPADDSAHNCYQRAAKFLRTWRGEGVLQRDPDPALYVYHQQFDYAGQRYLRRGFMTRVRLERFGEGRIYPHEETHAAAKADRLRLIVACKANLSPIFGLYPDPQNEAQQRLEDAIVGVAPLQATDDLDVVHRLWPVTDVQVIADVAALMNAKSLYVADGHHRYETACNYRDQLAAERPLDSSHPAHFVLTMCVSMDDPGLVVLPTHRLFRVLPPLASTELAEKLGDAFTTSVAGRGPQDAPRVWRDVEAVDQQHTLGLYAPRDDRWLLATLTAKGRAQLDDLSPEHGSEWQSLGVSILHRLVVETLLNIREQPAIDYVHLVEEVVQGLQTHDPRGGQYGLAALVMPATLDHIREISERGERMPAKSTYFYPKLLSGLVIHPLE